MQKKKAYVFIKVAAGRLDTIMRTLSSMPQVLSAEGVSGHVDVVAVITGPDLETLQTTILSTVRGIEGIESTETWIVMVPQPETWTREELDRFVDGLDASERASLEVLLERKRGMMVQELIDAVAEKVGDDNFDVHNLTVALTNMYRKADTEFRHENIFEFDQDMGYFLNETYLDMLEASLCR